MLDLHLIGVHEDGKHILLADRDGTQFRLAINDALRSVLRREYVDHSVAAEPLRPTEVQAMIRAGATASEAAQRAGWPLEKVHRYEGPILAERVHIAQLAGRAHVPVAAGAQHPMTLRDRVDERLEQRGVVLDDVDWDSWRSEDGQWTVEVTFPAGGRRRTASWHFSRSAMTVAPVDDESRWLSGEERTSGISTQPTSSGLVTTPVVQDRAPGEAPHAARPGSGRPGQVRGTSRDSEHRPEHRANARGDRRQTSDRVDSGHVAADPAPRSPHHDPDSELTAGLRERAAARGRRRPRRLATSTGGPTTRPSPDTPSRREGTQTAPALPDTHPAEPVGPAGAAAATSVTPTDIPDTGVAPDPNAVPLAPFDYDPATDGPPPGAHGDPQADGVDGRPEPSAGPPRTPGAPAEVPPEIEAPTGPGAPSPSDAQPPAGNAHNRSVTSEGVEEPELPLDHTPDVDASEPTDSESTQPADPSTFNESPEPIGSDHSDVPKESAKPAANPGANPRPTRTRRRRGQAAGAAAGSGPGAGSASADRGPLGTVSGTPEASEGAPEPVPPSAAERTDPATEAKPTSSTRAEQQAQTAPTGDAPRKAGSGRRNRASVPAWDDIMFGAKPPSS